MPKPFPAESPSRAAQSTIGPGTPTPQMMYTPVLDLPADGIPPARVTCRVLGFSIQSFYKWRKALLSQRDWDDAHFINAARDIRATTLPSAIGSSPTNFPDAGSPSARTGWRGWAIRSGSGLGLRQEAWTEPSIRTTRSNRSARANQWPINQIFGRCYPEIRATCPEKKRIRAGRRK